MREALEVVVIVMLMLAMFVLAYIYAGFIGLMISIFAVMLMILIAKK